MQEDRKLFPQNKIRLVHEDEEFLYYEPGSQSIHSVKNIECFAPNHQFIFINTKLTNDERIVMIFSLDLLYEVE